MQNGASIQLQTGTIIPLNSWNHVAFTLDSTGSGTLYVNGILYVPFNSVSSFLNQF